MATPSAERTQPTPESSQQRGVSTFRRAQWAFDDLYATRYFNTIVWRCPSHHILNLYNTNIAASHLEVLGDSVYYLGNARLPSATPRITLLSPQAERLADAAQRLEHYQPATLLGDAREPVGLGGPPVESIGLTYVLHSLPGTLAEKAPAVLGNLRQLLAPGGRLFGATVLADAEDRGWLARGHIALRNRSGVFTNAQDHRNDLERALRTHFRSVTVYTIGAVALFSGRV